MALIGRRNSLANAAFVNQGPQTAQRSTVRRLMSGLRSDGLLASFTTDNARTERGYLPPPQIYRMQSNPIEPPPLPSLRGGSRLTTALPSAGERYSGTNDLGT